MILNSQRIKINIFHATRGNFVFYRVYCLEFLIKLTDSTRYLKVLKGGFKIRVHATRVIFTNKDVKWWKFLQTNENFLNIRGFLFRSHVTDFYGAFNPRYKLF